MALYLKVLVTTMKPTLAIIALIALVGCDNHSEIVAESHDNKPPPGFSIVCDHTGRYAVKRESGMMILFYYQSDKPYVKTRSEAIARAWGQYEYEKAPTHFPSGQEQRERESRAIKWQDCDK